jgi:hypothetical protein
MLRFQSGRNQPIAPPLLSNKLVLLTKTPPVCSISNPTRLPNEYQDRVIVNETREKYIINKYWRNILYQAFKKLCFQNKCKY